MNKLCVIKRIQKILRGKGGFSFTELLVATLIMVLATGALTSALALGFRHFYLATQRTEAQFLCAALAEFVEDELSFSTVDFTGSDLTWSKGTHNMGSKISFYVQDADGSNREKITADTISHYGRIVITGENYKNDDSSYKYFKIVSDGAYEVESIKNYSLLAGMSLKWDPDKKWYAVKIVVVNKDNEVLSDTEFTVKPAIG